MIVVDASAAVKLLLVESDSDRVRHWFRTVPQEFIAPELLTVEVAQAVVRRINARQIALQTGRAALDGWRWFLENGGIALSPMGPARVDAAAGLAISLGHPVKDCLYLALALENGCDLMTCDAKSFQKACALYPQVRLLSEIS